MTDQKQKPRWINVFSPYDKYKVSSNGEIIGPSGKKLKFYRNKKGYEVVGVWGGVSARKSYQVHRIVAISFLGYSKNAVNHKNGIKHDNRLENLEFVTNKENMQHAVETGLFSYIGESNPNAKLKERDVIKIFKMLKAGIPQKEIAKKYGVIAATINEIRKGIRWKHLNLVKTLQD